jgi:hypothetical protein
MSTVEGAHPTRKHSHGVSDLFSKMHLPGHKTHNSTDHSAKHTSGEHSAKGQSASSPSPQTAESAASPPRSERRLSTALAKAPSASSIAVGSPQEKALAAFMALSQFFDHTMAMFESSGYAPTESDRAEISSFKLKAADISDSTQLEPFLRSLFEGLSDTNRITRLCKTISAEIAAPATTKMGLEMFQKGLWPLKDVKKDPKTPNSDHWCIHVVSTDHPVLHVRHNRKHEVAAACVVQCELDLMLNMTDMALEGASYCVARVQFGDEVAESIRTKVNESLAPFLGDVRPLEEAELGQIRSKLNSPVKDSFRRLITSVQFNSDAASAAARTGGS